MTSDAPQPAETPRSQGTVPAPDEPLTTASELMIIEPDRAAAAADVMVLPEPDDRTRPTVDLDRRARPLVTPADRARQQQLLETSPFWLSEQERAARDQQRRDETRPAHRRGRGPRNPVTAMLTLLLLSMVAAFFGWVSAEPFWLAVGHGERGHATTVWCQGDGLSQRCVGRFTSADGRITVSHVRLLGVAEDARRPGAVSPARMVSPGSGQAYAERTGPLMHLRWTLGFLLVLSCGYGIAGGTGARRLESAQARRGAVLASVAGPVLLLALFLAAAY